jgi:MFS family permease
LPANGSNNSGMKRANQEVESKATAGTTKRVVLIIAVMSSFLTPFTSSSVNIALPSIGTQLSLNAVALSWVATAYLLAAAAFLVPFGRTADIYGRKMIFRFGIIIDAIASILCATSSSGEWLIVFRALQGVGGAMIFGTGIAILTSVFPNRAPGLEKYLLSQCLSGPSDYRGGVLET